MVKHAHSSRQWICLAIGSGLILSACLVGFGVIGQSEAVAQQVTPGGTEGPTIRAADDSVLLTVILKHDQSKTLDEIRAQLDETGFWKAFPPEGIQVESWYVMMGIGHVVTLRVPPSRVRDVNLAVEKAAWKAFRSEFYLTYDYKPIAAARR